MGGVYETQKGKIVSDLKNSLNERLSGFMCEATTKLLGAKFEPGKAREIINQIIIDALEEKRRNTLVFAERPFEYDSAQDPRD